MIDEERTHGQQIDSPLPNPKRRPGSLPGYLRQQRDAVLAADPGVRAGDAEALHDMRVAVRRLRGTLRTYRPLLDRAHTEPVRAELHWLGGLLGAVRDGDVLSDRLGAAIAAEPPELVVGPVAARVEQRLAARSGTDRAELTAALDGPRYGALLDALDTLVHAAPAGIPGHRLVGLARKAVRRADRRLDAAGRARSGPGPGVPLPVPGAVDRDTALHEARKAYKRARYAVEAVVPVGGGPAARLVKRLRKLQDVLGDYHDTVVAGRLMREYGMRAHLDGENAFSYGFINAQLRTSGERRLADLDRARRRAAKRRVRAWLG